MVGIRQLITTIPSLISLALGSVIIVYEEDTTYTATFFDEYEQTETTNGATFTVGEPAYEQNTKQQPTRVSAESPSITTVSSLLEKTSTLETILSNSETSTSTFITTTLSKSTFTLSPTTSKTTSSSSLSSSSVFSSDSASAFSSDAQTPFSSISTLSPSSSSSASSFFQDYITSLLNENSLTSTSIVFTATSSVAPVSSLTGSIISASVETTQNQPLITSSLSSSSQSASINTESLTSAVTLTSSLSLVPADSVSTSTTVTVVAPTVVATSTYQTTTVSTSLSTFFSVSTVSTTTPSVYYSNDTSNSDSIQISTTAEPSATPLLSTSTSVSTSLVTIATVTTSKITSSSTSTTVVATSSLSTVDLFEAIATASPVSEFGPKSNAWSFNDNVKHDGAANGQTNKFYINLLLDNQEYPAFSYPYILWKLTSTFFGFAVQHTNTGDYTFAQNMDNGSPRVFTNPLNQADLVFSSTSFSSANDFNMVVDNLEQGSVLATLQSSTSGSTNYIDFPIVHGMGFASAIYHGALIPRLDSGMNIQSITAETSSNLATGILKYRVSINNIQWLVYVTNPLNDNSFSFTTEYSSQTGYSIVGNVAIDGLIIQSCVAPASSDLEVYYDLAAGMYVTSFQMSGSSDGITASYAYDYTTVGKSASGNTIIFVLPHQMSVLDSATSASNTGIEIEALVKGMATGFLATSIGCSESLNTEISWLPWSTQLGSTPLTYSSSQLQQIADVANSELNVNIKDSVINLNAYYGGKVLDKYAYILLTVSDIIQDDSVTGTTLNGMKEAFAAIFKGEQVFPLKYDTTFGGIISDGDWSSISDTSDNFGNSHYNDHHFHYGYIIHAAAVVGHVDKKLGGSWAEDNKDFINALIRDVANPSSDDAYFPVSRYFDWFDGHSWASGMYYDINGNDEESTSEDYNFLYAMKMWATVIGDSSMQYRSDLMIQAMSRSMKSYFYFTNDNDVLPAQVLPNKVAGITFENFLDYATYFGLNTEYIHGIHMIPITPVSSQMRSQKFVSEEWIEMLAPIIDNVSGGWKGLLKLNQALYDPASSYSFFSDSGFDASYLDGGMSQTWSLAFTAGISNSLGLI